MSNLKNNEKTVNFKKNYLNELYTELKEKPYNFSFFQACFLLEKVHLDKKYFACGVASSEPIRLVSYIHASTPFSTCIKFNERNSFLINSPALIGYNGILPNHYAEQVFFLEKQKNFLLSDFFNIFHHRYYSIKYKLEKKYSQTLTSKSKFKEVFELSGINNNKEKDSYNPFLSLLIMKNKTRENLQILLENLIHTTVEIHEFQKKWFDIPLKHQFYLNRETLIDKALGSQTQVDYSAIKIIFFFDNFDKYMLYLENTIKQKKVFNIIKYFLNGEVDFSIQLKIKKYTTKTFTLNFQNKLGITTWV